MSSDEWELIKQVFEAALAAPPESRSEIIERLCGDNPLVGETVRSLLNAHTDTGSSDDLIEHHAPRSNVLQTGDLVAGRFRIVKLLGRGGMGEVYEAYDERLRIRLALKTLRMEYVADADARARFEREIRVARELSHDGLCHVYDLEEHRDARTGQVVPCVTMELLNGETLQSYIQAHRPLPEKTASSLILQIGAALKYLHEHGVVHRDLKPSNIMLCGSRDDGFVRAVVMDFGLAKPLNPADDCFQSRADFRAGAPFFMAPELLRGHPPTIRSDIYAFALVIDEMITERRAFPDDALHTLYFERLMGKPDPPANRARELPPSWNEAILSCLDPEPSRRPASVAEALGAFDLTGREAPKPSRTPGSQRRRRVLAAAALLLCILALGAWISRPLETSLLVFPVENLTSEPAYNYIAKATNLEITGRLSRLDGLRVIPYYEPRSKTEKFPSVARFALFGYLQSADGHPRLVMQLAETRDGAVIWTGTFSGSPNASLQLLSDIAEGALRAVEQRLVLGPAPLSVLWSRILDPLRRRIGLGHWSVEASTIHAEAWDLYSRGQYVIEDRTVPAALKAIELFNRALRIEPGFARAHAALAHAQFVLMDFQYEPIQSLVLKAEMHARRALSLDARLARAHLMLAAARQTAWDWENAERSYRSALELDPKDAMAHRWYGGYLAQFGRFDEALTACRHAMELDPFNYPNRSGTGLYLYFAERYKEAAEVLEALLSEKDLLMAHVVLGDVYARMAWNAQLSESDRLMRQALVEAEAVAQKERDANRFAGATTRAVLVRSDAMFALYHAIRKDTASAQPYLRRLEDAVRSGDTSPVPLAEVYCVLGRRDEALKHLRRAFETRDRQLLYVKVNPFLHPLRDDREFQLIVQYMSL